MFTASAKIRKPGGAQPDEFEQSMSQVLCSLDVSILYVTFISIKLKFIEQLLQHEENGNALQPRGFEQ